MTVIQILIVVFALFAISRTVWQFKRGSLTIAWLLFWIVFWLVAATVAVLPQTTDTVARFVGVGRGADAVIYFSLVALFYLVFRTYVKIEKTENEITKLVRKLSLDELDDK
jgi:small membrane protein